MKNKFAVVAAGQFLKFGSFVGLNVPAFFVRKNEDGFQPIHRFAKRKDADAEALHRASWFSENSEEFLVVKHCGSRRGWVVVAEFSM